MRVGPGSVTDPVSETEFGFHLGSSAFRLRFSKKLRHRIRETESSSSISDSRISSRSSSPLFLPLSLARHRTPHRLRSRLTCTRLVGGIDEASLCRVDINAYVSSHVEDESSNEFTSRRRVVFTRYFLARRILTCLWDASQCVSYALLSSTRYKT